MSHPLIRDSEHYVILEPCKDEKFLTEKKTLKWLESWISKMEEIPQDLKNQPSMKAAAQRLLDTACDLEIKPGFSIEWFAIRVENTNSE